MCVGTDMKLSPLYVQEMENKMWLHIPHSIFFFSDYGIISRYCNCGFYTHSSSFEPTIMVWRILQLQI